ncbi:hypothetical protein ZWY2020_055067 [Hordeum vulgare]|nr:hypothetical protein ZWY2020_055067 [Hordeum vulgare]
MASSSWKKWPDHVRNKWRDDLRDKDFWFNGYLKRHAYDKLVIEPSTGSYVCWNVGVGPMNSFTRAISGMAVEGMLKYLGKFKHVIKVDLKPIPMAEQAQGRGLMSTKYQLALAAAKELGLLDQQYNWLKEMHDELQYYTYGCDDDGRTSEDLEWHVQGTIVPQVIKHLVTQQYMLVAENLQWSIELDSLTQDAGLLPPTWSNSRWLISTTSHDASNKSKSHNDHLLSIDEDEHVMVLTLYALNQSAEHILRTICQESKEYWHHIALQCFHYAMAIFAKHSQVAAVTSDELIHHWAAQGILPSMVAIKEEGEETCNTVNNKSSNMNQVGRVILEAFQNYTFNSLEHLHLEDCPRLEHVVPHTATLPCLKTLDIVFCYNLKTIFITSYTQDDTYQLPSLQTIRLQELPLLQHFHTNDDTITAPVWKELHVRGCWSLRHLPRLQGRQLEAVKVNGERSWWSKLQWGSPLHLDSYDPKLPPEFASFDERAEMSSYLR